MKGVAKTGNTIAVTKQSSHINKIDYFGAFYKLFPKATQKCLKQ